jgi:hypothetical protein
MAQWWAGAISGDREDMLSDKDARQPHALVRIVAAVSRCTSPYTIRILTMKTQWILALSISLLSFVALEGCAVDGPPKFPDPQSATLTGGTFVNVDNLRSVAPGLSKDQMVIRPKNSGVSK